MISRGVDTTAPLGGHSFGPSRARSVNVATGVRAIATTGCPH
jgi:hypothetical protein